MADFDIQIEGLDRLDEALQELAWPAARRALRKGMRAGANIVRDEARQKAPVKTGKLRRRIRTRERREENGWMRFAIEVPQSVFYGRFFEFGTSKQPARPFLRPAAANQTDAAVAQMRSSLAEAIELEMQRARR